MARAVHHRCNRPRKRILRSKIKWWNIHWVDFNRNRRFLHAKRELASCSNHEKRPSHTILVGIDTKRCSSAHTIRLQEKRVFYRSMEVAFKKMSVHNNWRSSCGPQHEYSDFHWMMLSRNLHQDGWVARQYMEGAGKTQTSTSATNSQQNSSVAPEKTFDNTGTSKEKNVHFNQIL